MSTAIVKQRVEVTFENPAEPLIPLPGAKLRRWLLGGLVAWQVAIFWLLPGYLFLRESLNFEAIFSQNGNLFQLRLDDQIVADIYTAMALALGANLAFFLTKTRFGIPIRVILAFSLWSGGITGVCFAFSRSYFVTIPLFIVANGTAVLFAGAVFWLFVPGLGSRRLIHLQERTNARGGQSQQLRLTHLFYILSASAIVCLAIRWLPDPNLMGDAFHEPIDNILILALSTMIACILSASTYFFSLSQKYGTWLLVSIGAIVPLLAVVASYFNEGITGNPWNYQLFFSYLRTLSIAFCLMSGTALALRLLGYRLVKAN